MSFETKTVYFDGRGPDYTDETLRLAKERAETLGIRDVVLASNTGETGLKACKVFAGYNVVVVTHVAGYREPNRVAMLDENRAAIEASGGSIVQAGHAFGMLGRAVNRRFGVIQVDELIANVLRLISQGVKVGCECTCMAADAGLVRSGEQVIAIGGSGRGADSAIVLKASNTHTFFETRVLEVICKPRD